MINPLICNAVKLYITVYNIGRETHPLEEEMQSVRGLILDLLPDTSDETLISR